MCSFFQLVSCFRRPLNQLGRGFDLAPLALGDSLVACGCMVMVNMTWNVNQIGVPKKRLKKFLDEVLTYVTLFGWCVVMMKLG